MNVSDFQEKLPEGDMLRAIFAKQVELVQKYHSIESKNMGRKIPYPLNSVEANLSITGIDLDDPICQDYLKNFAWRVTEELGEAMNCLKNKPWKLTHMPTDRVHFFEEMIDAMHFFVELLILCGMTPEAATIMYMNKNEVNRFRIRSGY